MLLLAHLVIDPVVVICSFVAGVAIGCYLWSKLPGEKEEEK